MFKARHILSVILLNFALFCLFSVYQEFNLVDDKITNLEYTVSNAVDSAVQLSMVSEELFGSDTSWATGKVSSKNANVPKLEYYTGSRWVKNDLYATSMYFSSTNGGTAFSKFPATTISKSSEDVYNWLYTNSTNFKTFYSSVGKYITTPMYVKSGSSTSYGGNYNLVSTNVPVLDQMGMFSGTLATNSDSFRSVMKTGKQLQRVSSGSYSYSLPTSTSSKSRYLLTPTSLGITYLDPRVLKPAVIAHLETGLRYGKGENGATESVGVIPANIRIPAGGVYKPAIKTGQAIMNNGVIEIDMSTVKVSVTFALVDAYIRNNAELMSLVTGATGGYRNEILRGSDTSTSVTGDAGKRIVAKVVTTMDVYVPYTTPVMQWVRYIGRLDAYDHLSIRGLNSSNNFASTSSSSMKYTYTTYVSIER